MKKVSKKLLFMSFTIIFCLFIASCSETNSLEMEKNDLNSHSHIFSKEFKTNEDLHWQECECGLKNNEKKHSFDVVETSSLANTFKIKRVCSVCQYEMETELPHQHTYSDDWSYTDSVHYYQATCEHKEETKQVGAHTYGAWSILHEAQENEPGIQKRVCSVCKYEQVKEIPALRHKHTYSNVWSSDETIHYYQATCEHEGERTKVGTHTYGAWSILREAQENEPGIQKRVCEVCKYEQIKEISNEVHQHEFSTIWTIDKNPSCESIGSKSHHCLTCDEKADITEIPSIGHTYSRWEVVLTPTPSSSGILKRTCQNDCNHTETYELPLLNVEDYNYQLALHPTCEEEGVGKYTFIKDNQFLEFTNQIPASGHNIENQHWQFDLESHWMSCTVCEEAIALSSHTLNDESTCTVCGYIHNLGTPGLYYILTGDGSSYAVTDYFGKDTVVEIPEKHNNLPVTRIGEEIFFKQQNITEIRLPSTITRIGAKAFEQCFNLAKINLPNGLLEIGDSAFSSCVKLKEISIPDSVQAIGNSAFYACINLKELIIPDSVLTIGDSAFTACQGLTKLVISKNVTYIGDMAFQGCFGITSITIPGTIQTINTRAFALCNSLETVIVSEGVEIISNYVFGECKNLKQITLPKSLRQIKDGTFDLCENLSSIYYEGTRAEWQSLTQDGFQHYLSSPTIYTYAAQQPGGSGNYWYYDENKNILKW